MSGLSRAFRWFKVRILIYAALRRECKHSFLPIYPSALHILRSLTRWMQIDSEECVLWYTCYASILLTSTSKSYTVTSKSLRIPVGWTIHDIVMLESTTILICSIFVVGGRQVLV
jgi:hypothetical protein